MSSHLHGRPDGSAEATHPEAAQSERAPSTVRISVTVANHYTFDTHLVTGQQIKETSGVPAGFSLYRRTPDGNHPVPDDTQVELRNGDHFFARPAP